MSIHKGSLALAVVPGTRKESDAHAFRPAFRACTRGPRKNSKHSRNLFCLIDNPSSRVTDCHESIVQPVKTQFCIIHKAWGLFNNSHVYRFEFHASLNHYVDHNIRTSSLTWFSDSIWYNANPTCFSHKRTILSRQIRVKKNSQFMLNLSETVRMATSGFRNNKQPWRDQQLNSSQSLKPEHRRNSGARHVVN